MDFPVACGGAFFGADVAGVGFKEEVGEEDVGHPDEQGRDAGRQSALAPGLGGALGDGNQLGEGDGVELGVAVGVGLGVTDGVAEGVGLGAAEGIADGVGETTAITGTLG